MWPDHDPADGPSGDDQVLRATIAAVHAASARSARRRVTAFACAAALVVAIAMEAGAAIGHLGRHSVTVADTTVFTATDARSGAHLSVTTVAETGWTRLRVQLTGLPVGTACHLTVSGRHGSLVDGGSWRAGSTDHSVSLSAAFDLAALAEVDVVADNGVHLAAVRH